MESPQSVQTAPPFGTTASSRSRSSSKLDDVTSLTSYNPFSEEDENDYSSYALVTSLFSRVKNTLSAPLSTAAAANIVPPANGANTSQNAVNSEIRRPSIQNSHSNTSNKSASDRPPPMHLNPSNPAPPLVSLTPVVSEVPSYVDSERAPSRTGSLYSPDVADGGYGTYIPGFPIPDSDARSIRTTASTKDIKRSASVSKVIRRIRGEGTSSYIFWSQLLTCIRVVSGLLDGR